mgnify:CR=1 FL=1
MKKKLAILGALVLGSAWCIHRNRKYPLAKGYGLFNKVAINGAVINTHTVKLGNKLLAYKNLPNVPSNLIRESKKIKTRDNAEINLSIYKAKDMNEKQPCLVYFHGGGFFLKDEAYEQLVQMIDDGKFEYDKKYSLNQIAIELNMSKTPVRDAIQKLADEKRIDILPSRGIQLHMPTADEVKQHYHFSNAIEGYCVAELAKAYAKNPKNIYVRRLKYIMQDMKAYLDEQTDFGEYFALDRQFHIELIDSLQDPYFSSLKSSGMGFLNHPELQLNEKVPRQDVYACHEKILDAICKGNHSAAFDAMMEHAQLITNQL